MRRKERGITKPGEPKRMRAKGLTCTVEGCGDPAFSRGMCRRHYRRAAKGLPLTTPDDAKQVGVTPSGQSLWGVVEHDGDRLICHECGRSYINLAVHIGAKHCGVKEYKLAHGLLMSQSLVADDLRDRMRTQGNSARLADARTPDTLKDVDPDVVVRGIRLRRRA